MCACACEPMSMYAHFQDPTRQNGFVTSKCTAKASLALAKRALGVIWCVHTLLDRPRTNKISVSQRIFRERTKDRRTDTLHSHWVYIQFFLTFSFCFFSANNFEFVILAVCVVFDLSFCHQHPLAIAILNAWFITLLCFVDLFKWS